MPGSKVSMKKGSIASQYLKRTAQILGSTAGDYFREASPTVVSAGSEMRGTLRSFQNGIASQVIPKTKQLSIQIGFRRLNQWFLNEENGLGDDQDLGWDVDVSAEDESAAIADVQISAGDRQANQISKTVVETSHRLVEAQISATANMMTGIEHLGATMSSGFDSVNATLNKILEVTTKNTAAMIEVTAAAGGGSGVTGAIRSNGQLDVGAYKKLIENNLKNSQLSMLSTVKSLATGGMITPEAVIGGVLKNILDKKNPNLKKNLQAFDSTVNDLLINSLIRLGEKSNRGGGLGALAKIFGINSTRERGDAKRPELELKTVQFNTLSQEAIVTVLPGYMQRILKQLGGGDVLYDYKSRQFRSKPAMQREYQDRLAGDTGAFRRATGNNVKQAFGGKYNNDKIRDLMYDLMMEEFGSIGSEAARNKISGNSGKQVVDQLLKNVGGAKQFQKVNASDLQSFAADIESAKRNQQAIAQLLAQSSFETVSRNRRLSELQKEGLDYHRDTGTMKDNGRDKNSILRRYGLDQNGSGVAPGKMGTASGGVDYTNLALYEIHRVLSKGINVFEVGRNTGSRRQSGAFDHATIAPPIIYKPRGQRPNKVSPLMEGTDPGNGRGPSDAPVDENGSRITISESGGKAWGKASAKDFKDALFSGDSARVRDVTSRIFGDATAFAGSKLKKFFGEKDNDINFSGWLKENLFGKRDKDAEGNTIKTSRGILGSLDEYIFGEGGVKGVKTRIKDSTSKWFKSAAGYFNNGQSKEDGGQTQDTRKKILGASIGMVAGLGFLGGPLGLIAGGLVGNALAGTEGIGGKIKDVLFGKDYTDKKGKEKHKLGVLERVVNGITDPLRYQLGKTATALGALAKKNILGPLANLGEAIKDRVANAAATKAGKVFGWIFEKGSSLIQTVMMAPFKLMGAAGKAARGAATVGTGAVGGALNFLSDRLAVSDEAKAKLKANRAKYKDDYDATVNGSDYYAPGGQKAWIRQQNERRKERGGMGGLMNEKISELVETTKAASEQSAEVGAKVSDLADAGLHEGSIYTHDVGIHDRIDRIVSILEGKFRKDEENQFANAMASTGVTAAMSGNFNKDDADDAAALTDIASKDGVSKPNLVAKMKAIFKRNVDMKQKGDSEEKEEKGSFLSTLMSGAMNLLGSKGGLIALLGGALALFNKDVRDFLGDLLGGIGSNLLEGLKNLGSWIWNGGDDKNAVLNTMTSPADVRTPSAANYFVPGASLYHVKTDAAGNDITNQTMTHAKDVAVTSPVQLAAMNRLRFNAAQQGADTAVVRASLAGNTSDTAAAKYTSQAAKMQAQADKLAGGSKGASVAGGAIANVGAGMVVGAVAGKAAGAVASGLLEQAGVSEEWAERGGRATETVVQVVGTTKAVSGKGVFGWVKDKLLWLLGKLTDAVKSSKTYGKIATVVSEKFDKVAGMVTEKVLQPLLGKISGILAKMGIETTAAGLTLGLSVAVMAGVGAITGGCNTENLFGVLPGEADAKMTTIATFLGAIFGLPYVSLIEILDIIIDPVFHKGVRQLLAEMLYVGLSIDQEAAQAKLDKLTDNFQVELSAYNEKFGTDVNASTFNDMVNRGLGSKIIRGGTRMTTDGHVMTDEAGAVVTKGGLGGLFVGRTGYAHDSEGNVIFQDGKAVTGIDAHGRQTYAAKLDENGNEIVDADGNAVLDKKWGNYVGDAAHAVNGFLFGEKTYKTDDTGNVLYDSEGKPILDSQGKNIFGKIGDAAVSAKNALGELFFGKKDADPEKEAVVDGSVLNKDGTEGTASNLFGRINSSFKGCFDGINSDMNKLKDSTYELDENGNPILDENGKKVKKGGFGNMLKRTVGGIGSSIAGSLSGVLDMIKSKGLVGAAADGIKSVGNKIGDFFGSLFNSSTVSTSTGSGYIQQRLFGRGDNVAKNTATTSYDKLSNGSMSLTDQYIKQLSPVDATSISDYLPGDSEKSRIKNLFYQGNYSKVRHMADAGCGPISAAFLSSLYGKTLTPMTAAEIMSKAQWRDASGATSLAGIEAVGSQMGIGLTSSKPDVSLLVSRLHLGSPVILLGKSDDPNSPFTKSGHFIVATGMDRNGMVSVMDPLAKAGKKYRLDDLLNGLESMTYTKRSELPSLINELPMNAIGGAITKIGGKLATFAPVNTVVKTVKNVGSAVASTGKKLVRTAVGSVRSLFGRGGGFGPGENESIDLLNNFPIYLQGGNSPWANRMYSATNNANQTMATSACGPTSMAMVLAGATGKHFSPYQAAQYAISKGYRTANSGTDWGYFNKIAGDNNLSSRQNGFSTTNVDQALSEGKPVILAGSGARPFTKSGHFITVVGKSANGKYLVNDPNNHSGEYTSLTGANQMWSFSKKDGSPILGNTSYDRSSNGVTTDDSTVSGKTKSTGIFGMISDVAKSIITKFNETFGLDQIGKDNITEAERDPENNTRASDTGAPSRIEGPVEYLTTVQVAAIQTNREAKEIIDLKTMKTINFSWAASATYHSDMTPMSPADVNTIKSILHPSGGVDWNDTNSWSWDGRPGVLKLKGRYIACGFHLRPHAAIMGGSPGAPFANKSNTAFAYGSQKWPLGGHVCCYYGDSPGGTQSCNAAAKEAYRLGNEIFKSQPTATVSAGGYLPASVKSNITNDGIGGFGDVSPLDKNFKVTSPFGPRSGGQHNGIDLVPDDGSKAATVHVTESGTVASQGYHSSAGNYVTVNGDDGRLYQFYHLKNPSALQKGQSVTAGQLVGDMGSTGHSTGPHLHYGIKENGSFVNPASYLANTSPANSAGLAGSSSTVANTSNIDSSLNDSSKSVIGRGVAMIASTFKSVGNKFLSILGINSSSDSELSASNYTSSGNSVDLGGFTSVQGDVAASVYNYLIQKGCSAAAACGVLGNAQQESGLNPAVKQYGGGPGRGLFQWEEGSDRFAALCAVASKNGKSWSDLESQLMFLWSELNTSDIDNRFKGKHGPVSSQYADIFERELTKAGGHSLKGGFAEWKKLNDVKLATSNFEGAYERAGTPMMENRWKAAQGFYDRFSKEAKVSQPVTSTDKSMELSSTGNDSYGGVGGSDTVPGVSSSMARLASQLQTKSTGSLSSIGGSTDSTSLSARYGSATSTASQSKLVGSAGSKIRSAVRPISIASSGKTAVPGSDEWTDIGGAAGSRPNLQVLEGTLSLVLAELQAINANTYGANGYLSDITQKDFAGGGLGGDGGKKMSQAIKKRQQEQKAKGGSPFPYNPRNVSSVMSIVRPT